MTSSNIQAKISEWADRNGFLYNKIVSAARSGWPDCILIIHGITYYFEVKFKSDKLRPLQKRKIQKMNKHDTIAFVIYNFRDFLNIVERILNGKNHHLVD